ncbi:unnamed protein product [Vicia faba]|uniref:Uncharacterized protein n=1 Tax=Vicia faba TaxID=3906 RepID=A0AAV0ZYX7_VICFA|nr:unnamed protein product [Vicia faba]
MIGSRLCIQPITAVTSLTADHTNAATSRSVSHSISFDFSPIHLPLLRSRRFHFPKPKSFLISCNSSPIRSTSGDHHHNNNDTDFLEASLLLSETITHYGMWRHRFQDELQWKSPISSFPQHTSRTDSSLLRQDVLQTFQNPTIFLKISCDGDYVLPIVVGRVAIEKLIDTEVEEESEDFPDQFQFVKNLVERLDHEVWN